MKKLIIIAGAGAVLTAALLLTGCGKQTEQQAASKSEPAPAAQTAQKQPEIQAVAAYPLNWCVVSGEELGKMGPPVDYNYNGRQIKFCCNMCVKTFEKEPARFLARIDSAAAGQIKKPAEAPEEGSGG